MMRILVIHNTIGIIIMIVVIRTKSRIIIPMTKGSRGSRKNINNIMILKYPNLTLRIQTHSISKTS